ncbi:hypothetical protein [Pseudomonas aeruginosa]|uniref:hypothetical protein n=1 Tax=Pseudomonas aeruginosa TaxID=287 RepID=UPI00320F9382
MSAGSIRLIRNPGERFSRLAITPMPAAPPPITAMSVVSSEALALCMGVPSTIRVGGRAPGHRARNPITLAARRRRAASGCNPPVTVALATAEQQAAPADQQKLLEQTSNSLIFLLISKRHGLCKQTRQRLGDRASHLSELPEVPSEHVVTACFPSPLQAFHPHYRTREPRRTDAAGGTTTLQG